MLPARLVEPGPLERSHRVAELVEAQRRLQVGEPLRPSDARGGALGQVGDPGLVVPAAAVDPVVGPDGAVELVPGHGEPVLRHGHLLRAVVQRQQDCLRSEDATEETGDRLSRQIRRIVKLFAERGVRVGLGQDVAVAVAVVRMFLGKSAFGRRLTV